MVEYPVHLKPLWPDTISVEPLLEIVWVLGGSLVLPAVRTPVLEGWWFVHVRLFHVVPEHGRMVDIQLGGLLKIIIKTNCNFNILFILINLTFNWLTFVNSCLRNLVCIINGYQEKSFHSVVNYIRLSPIPTTRLYDNTAIVTSLLFPISINQFLTDTIFTTTTTIVNKDKILT